MARTDYDDASYREGFGARLALGDFHYDHVIPDALGGEPTLMRKLKSLHFRC